MSIAVNELGLIHYPDAVLRAKARHIESVNNDVRAVARRMIEIMHEEEGIGLAAPQIGLSWRLFVADVPEDDEKGRHAAGDLPTATTGPIVYINPVIRQLEGPVEPFNEGCLSLPDILGEVLRPPIVTLDALDLEGKPFSLRAGGLLARCWQHELDHLDGVLILDRMSQASRLKNRPLIKKLERDG